MIAINKKVEEKLSLSKEYKEITFLELSHYSPKLEEMQKFVGGFVEIIYDGENQILINEDGISLNLEVNIHASLLLRYNIWGNALKLSGDALLS